MGLFEGEFVGISVGDSDGSLVTNVGIFVGLFVSDIAGIEEGLLHEFVVRVTFRAIIDR